MMHNLLTVVGITLLWLGVYSFIARLSYKQKKAQKINEFLDLFTDLTKIVDSIDEARGISNRWRVGEITKLVNKWTENPLKADYKFDADLLNPYIIPEKYLFCTVQVEDEGSKRGLRVGDKVMVLEKGNKRSVKGVVDFDDSKGFYIKARKQKIVHYLKIESVQLIKKDVQQDLCHL